MTPESVPIPARPRFKAEQIQRILERRIRHGDYYGRDLPTERDLAQEIGVSRMTARKAVQRLVEQGLLLRQTNGRVTANRTGPGQLRIAFLVPSLSSQDTEHWRLGVERVAGQLNASVRTMLYVHWDDPAIVDALDSFDGVFLQPSCEPIPNRIIARLRGAGRGVVILGRDLTALGIPSVDLFPPVFIQRLLDYLAELGHRSVDCFNIQTVDPVIEQRIEQWNLWRAVHRMGGRLLGEPIQPYDSPLSQAYRQAGRLLDQKQFTGSAMLCTTTPAAIGAIRALRDRKIQVGVDVSVCAVNDEGLGRYLSPSLTSIEMPDPLSYLSVCMEWMQRSGEGWIGSLLMQPSQVPIFIGESTGPRKADAGGAKD
jgi:DNA-binding LacI/PurR family transcriptional regulator